MIVNTSGKPKGKKETRCCIDLGSSYFRKLTVKTGSGEDAEVIEEFVPGSGADAEDLVSGKDPVDVLPRLVDPVQERIFVGWGEDVEHKGVISAGTMERAADILNRLTAGLAGRDDVRLTVVATNALRAAANRDEARKYLEDKAGVKINILSEKGEALLGFAGVTSGLEHGIPVIVLDMGGTSTEISWGTVPAGSAWASVPLGVHSCYDPGTIPGIIAEAFRGSGVPAGASSSGSGVPVGDSSLPGRDESHTIMLTGGTAVSLAVAWRQMNGEKYDDVVPVTLTIVEFEKVCDWLSAFISSGTGQELDLAPDRIRLLPQGIRLIREFIRALGAAKMTITARDLRWGVVLGDGILEWGYLADEQESPDSRR